RGRADGRPRRQPGTRQRSIGRPPRFPAQAEVAVKRAVASLARRTFVVATGALLAAFCCTGVIAQGANVPAPLRVIAFDGGWNLPVWAAQRQGFFEANGVSVTIAWTPSSAYLITALLDGRYDIALAGIDNLVAYQEGQGEAKIPEHPDLFAFLGNDHGFASLASAPA